MKTVINLFHPNYSQSKVNSALYGAVKDSFDVRMLTELYPDFNIDVTEEQKVLKSADRVVLQFPIRWYSTPALLKQWEDSVLTYGWAYGTNGTVLHGKQLLIAVTVGANNYGQSDFVKYTVNELLRPLQATSRLTGMTYLKPFKVMGASSVSNQDLQKSAQDYLAYLNNSDLPILGDFE